MRTREELSDILHEILGSDHVYYQPPASLVMKYPCFVYELDRVYGPKADDRMYLKRRRYAIKYISRDPDNTIIDTMLELPYCSFDRRFIHDNLYHDCFDLYF